MQKIKKAFLSLIIVALIFNVLLFNFVFADNDFYEGTIPFSVSVGSASGVTKQISFSNYSGEDHLFYFPYYKDNNDVYECNILSVFNHSYRYNATGSVYNASSHHYESNTYYHNNSLITGLDTISNVYSVVGNLFNVNYGWAIGKVYGDYEPAITKLTGGVVYKTWTGNTEGYDLTTSVNTDLYVTTHIVNNSKSFDLMLIAKEPFTVTCKRGNSTVSFTSYQLYIEDQLYYYATYNGWNWNPDDYTYLWGQDLQYTDFNAENKLGYYVGYYETNNSQNITFGDLKIGFSTDIAYSGGNQDAWRLNKDTIYFDRYDTLGNDLFGYLIELQAVPYSVYDQSKQNLLTKTVNDYVFDTVKVGSLGYWSPGQDYIDFTWEYITNRFSPTWWSTYGDNYSLVGWYLNEKWYRVGWAYRARLVDENNNVLIDWQWIYNGTSIDTEDVVNIIDNNGLTPELVNSINNINNYNNTTNNNTYNNQTINYYSSDQQSDGSWIEALLESILGTIADLVGKILDFFSNIFDGIVDLILGLFGNINPADSFFNWFSDLFNGIGDIDLTLPQFNLPETDLSSFNRLVQETLNIFSFNNFGFVIFIPLLLIIIKAVF